MSPAPSRREEILDRATAMANRVGLEGLSIGQLATELGMSKSGLFSHFNSKEGLQLAVVDWVADTFIQNVIRPALKTPRGKARLDAMFDGWTNWIQNNPFKCGCFFAAASSEMDDRPGPVRDRIAALQKDWLELVSNIAGTGVSEGDFRADLDTAQLAFEFNATFLGFNQADRLLRDDNALERTKRAYKRLAADAAA